METERNNDEESECQQLNYETDFHDCETSLLSGDVVRDTGNTTEDLDEEGNNIAGNEDRRLFRIRS